MTETSKNITALLTGILIIFLSFLFSPSGIEEKNKVNIEEKNNLTDFIDWSRGQFLGSEDAPVRIVNFSTHYCPFCHEIENNVFPTLKEEYIDTGKVVYYYRGIGNPDDLSFQAPYCASDKGLFWEYNGELYSQMIEPDLDSLTEVAVSLGLNEGNFVNCLQNQTYRDMVLMNSDEADRVGMIGTPHILIENTAVSGARPYQYYKQIIDQKLNENN